MESKVKLPGHPIHPCSPHLVCFFACAYHGYRLWLKNGVQRVAFVLEDIVGRGYRNVQWQVRAISHDIVMRP